jgi:hypothetical protein
MIATRRNITAISIHMQRYVLQFPYAECRHCNKLIKRILFWLC